MRDSPPSLSRALQPERKQKIKRLYWIRVMVMTGLVIVTFVLLFAFDVI